MPRFAEYLDPALWREWLAAGVGQLGFATFWFAVLEIIFINCLLSGDNALVIAMACRGLPAEQRRWGLLIGAGIAIALRIIFTGIVARLMLIAYLKLIGGLALLVIAARLLVPESPDRNKVEAVAHLWRAVGIIVAADLVMSLDNIIAIAAAARGDLLLLGIGLANVHSADHRRRGFDRGAARPLSDPDLGRRPALLGWVAGEAIASRSGAGGPFGGEIRRDSGAAHGNCGSRDWCGAGNRFRRPVAALA